MSHKNKKSLTRQIEERYKGMLALGNSKHMDKLEEKEKGLKNHEITGGKIYSINTMKAYMKHMNYFAKYCKELHGSRTLEQCRQYIDEYLESEQKTKSAYTVKLEAAAICKCYGMSTDEVIHTKSRIRADIKRSRGKVEMDKHFSLVRNKDLIDFCNGTGLRRREVEHVTGNNLKYINGKYYVEVTNGKGGKHRLAEIIGNKERIIEMFHEAKDNKIFERVNCKADIHGYRANYAKELYNQYARPISEIPSNEKYCCRADKKGVIYDKSAMLIVSRNLGHNRIDVIAGHYIG